MDIKDKTVLVTGSDGFIGSHLVETLISEGCRIKALALYNSFNQWGWLDSIDLPEQAEIITGDIRDPHFCNDLTRDTDLVFNLAALIAIPYSYKAPGSYFDTNIKGTMNLCQAALENHCTRLIHISTSEVYGTAKYVPIDESHPLQPQSPYSASKIGADAIAESFYHSFELPLVIARPFNTYGPRQSARAIIPTIISQIASGREKVSLGDLRPTRDFTFVTDTCKGLVSLMKSDAAAGHVVNIGTGNETSVLELFTLIRELMNSNIEIDQDAQRFRPENSEVFRLVCNASKLKEITGFSPETTLREGLLKTIDWFADPNNLKAYKFGIYNL